MANEDTIYGIHQLGSGGDNLYTGDRIAALNEKAFIDYLDRKGVTAINALDGGQLDSHRADYARISAPGDKGPGWGMQGYGGLALGAGQLGLGVLSYLDNEKTAKKNRALVDQQIATNKYVMDKSVKNDAAGTDVYNKVFGDRYGKL